MNINGRNIGPGEKPFVIAEIGINHEGEMDKARQMVIDASKAGAECVKFQSHIIADEMTVAAQKTIPSNTSESIYEIMSRCALSPEEELKLKSLTEDLGMTYLCTPFSRAAANHLENLGVEAYKIGSGECNNYPLVEHIARFQKPVILSTGMNDLSSIKVSVDILRKHNCPIALLHCTSLYPTPYDKVRLGGLQQLKESFGDCVVGLSDHSLGNYTCFAAIPLGAAILEKHFTSDKMWPGPDISISLDPHELNDLIKGSTAIHQALGGEKTILPEEQPTIDFAYASVVTIKPIEKGEKFTPHNTWVKRPGTGEIRAKHYEDILGKRAQLDLKPDLQLEWSHIYRYSDGM